MPWVPELFSAPVLEQLQEERRRDELLAVPYFHGLMAGEPDALLESFAGEPELHHPTRGASGARVRSRRTSPQRTPGSPSTTPPWRTSGV